MTSRNCKTKFLLVVFLARYFFVSIMLFHEKNDKFKAKYGARMRSINNTLQSEEGSGKRGKAKSIRDLRKIGQYSMAR